MCINPGLKHLYQQLPTHQQPTVERKPAAVRLKPFLKVSMENQPVTSKQPPPPSGHLLGCIGKARVGRTHMKDEPSKRHWFSVQSICCNLQLGTLYYKHVIGRVRGLALVTAGTLRTAHEVVSSNPSGSVSMHKSAVDIYC